MKNFYNNLFFTAIIAVVISTGAGWFLGSHFEQSRHAIQVAMWEGSEQGRNPAAIKKDFDFSRLSGKDLKLATRERILEDIKVVAKNNLVGLELGHFVVKGIDGSKEFGCGYYNRVQLTFIAEGIAEHGHSPKMTVDGPCEISKNVNRMRPIWMPVAEMLEMSPSNMRGYFFSVYDIFVDIEFVGSIWPKQWRLDEVKVFDQNKPEREMKADSTVVLNHFDLPFMMNW